MTTIEFIPVLKLTMPDETQVSWESDPVYASSDTEARDLLQHRIDGLPEITFDSWSSISLISLVKEEAI